MSTWDSKKKISFMMIIFMQLSVVIYTMSGVCGKYAAKFDFMSVPFIGMYVLDAFILGVYAILWQQIIKRIDLSIAYANKGTSLLWSLLWSVLLFREKLTTNNVIGIVVVMIGIILVNTDGTTDKEKELKKNVVNSSDLGEMEDKE